MTGIVSDELMKVESPEINFAATNEDTIVILYVVPILSKLELK